MKQVLRDALNDRGYTDLTPVQEAVLAPDLQGRDLLVSAQTGSGKTVGFGLAVAPQLLAGDLEQFERADAPLGLVIAPTRELALQVKRELSWLFAKAGAVIASCVGGMDMRDERRALSRGAHIVAATPGRLRDHIMRGSIDLTNLRAVVLDEADEMLDLGFREDLEFILGEAPEERQTLLFSATVPKSIATLAKKYQKDAERVLVKSKDSQHADISYNALAVADRDTENAVINTLLFHKAPNAIVFANTRAMVNRLTTRLSNRGFQVVALSGELSQSERTHALQAMRDGRAQVCVATDVAARGIDLPNLDLVVHAELPSNSETLLHRSGRTGRAGRKGVSALIVTRKIRKKAERILGGAKIKAEWSDAPSAEAVHAREEERMFSDETWATPAQEGEEAVVARLQETFSPEQLAAAYLRLYRSVRSTPEELSDAGAKPAPREEFGESIWFAVTGGRNAGAEPRRLLPMLCKGSNLTKNDIGAIRIKQDQSFVQIREKSVPGFLASLRQNMEIEPGAVISQLAEPPADVNEPSSRGGGFKRNGPKAGGPKGGPKSGAPRAPGPKKPKGDGPKPAQAKRNEPQVFEQKPSSAPVEWNDDPAPRAKKPKPKDRPPKPSGPKDRNPRSDKPKSGGKNVAPLVGKPNSKKNKARALAAKANATPKRKTGGKPKGPKS